MFAGTLLIYTVMGKQQKSAEAFCNTLSAHMPVKIITDCFLRPVPVMSALTRRHLNAMKVKIENALPIPLIREMEL